MTITSRNDDDIVFFCFNRFILFATELQCGTAFFYNEHFMGIAVIMVERVEGSELFPRPVVGIQDVGYIITSLKYILIDQKGKTG